MPHCNISRLPILLFWHPDLCRAHAITCNQTWNSSPQEGLVTTYTAALTDKYVCMTKSTYTCQHFHSKSCSFKPLDNSLWLNLWRMMITIIRTMMLLLMMMMITMMIMMIKHQLFGHLQVLYRCQGLCHAQEIHTYRYLHVHNYMWITGNLL